MKEVEFRCVHCGESKSVRILPLKHAIHTTRRRINQQSKCCDKPEYIDDQGFCEVTQEGSMLGMMPSIRT